jgi:hypothetical protein
MNGSNVVQRLRKSGDTELVPRRVNPVFRRNSPEHLAGRFVVPDFGETKGDDEKIGGIEERSGRLPRFVGVTEFLLVIVSP